MCDIISGRISTAGISRAPAAEEQCRHTAHASGAACRSRRRHGDGTTTRLGSALSKQSSGAFLVDSSAPGVRREEELCAVLAPLGHCTTVCLWCHSEITPLNNLMRL
ncbi:unnamed protein product [Boreogadus saida]